MSKYMNPIKAVSINFDNEPLLTIHCDGRVTTSDRLKPTETAVLALDQIKTQWMKDAQATKIRELQDQIERLEDWKESALAVEREWNANAIATMLGGKLGESQREVIQREVPKLLERIKLLEEVTQERDKEWFQVIESILGFHPVSMTEALRIGIERIKKQKQRIQRLVEAGDALKASGYFGGFGDAVNKWIKVREDKP